MNTGRTHFKKGHLPWNYKGGKPSCLICGKQLSTRTARKKPVVYCHKHKVKFGQEHHNWVNGDYKVSDRKHLDSAYMAWRKAVYKRDGFACRIANNECAGRLEAHHILTWREFPELRYEVNNGITLCRAHHPRKRAEEKRLAPVFQELVSVSSVLF